MEKMMNADDGDKSSATTSIAVRPYQKQAKLITAVATTQCKVNALIFDFVIDSAQPFSLVEDADFCKLIEGISSG